MKTLILLTAFLTASPVAPTNDPLMNVYLDQYLGVKVVPHKVSKKYFYRQIEFNTKFISSVVGPENLVTGMMNVDNNKKYTASYSVHATPRKLKEKLVTMSHFTRKTYPMGYKVKKMQWVGREDFKIHFHSENKSMILYFKYNEKHKLFNVWMR